MPHARTSWQRPAADEISQTRPTASPFDEHATGKVRKPSSLLGPGQIVGDRYCVHEQLAAGGMGRVYMAEHVALGRPVALKVLDPELTRKHPDFHRRFLLEAATCAAIKHPNVVTVYDYGRLHDSSDAYFMAMEMVEGEPLHNTVRREGRLDWPRATRLAYETARALRAAHQAGAIHRDLKPSNIMVVTTDEGESVKVLDFGLVKVLDAQTGTPERDSHLMMGSPTYMAPEQIRMGEVDARTDIYALGVILYFLLTGRHPFKGETPSAIFRQHLESPPPLLPPYVPGPLAEVVTRCLQKDPDARWPDANSLLMALAQVHAQSLRAAPLMATVPPSHAPRRAMLTGPLPLPLPALPLSATNTRSTVPPRAATPSSPASRLSPPEQNRTSKTPPPVPTTLRPRTLTGPLPRLDLQQLEGDARPSASVALHRPDTTNSTPASTRDEQLLSQRTWLVSRGVLLLLSCAAAGTVVFGLIAALR